MKKKKKEANTSLYSPREAPLCSSKTHPSLTGLVGKSETCQVRVKPSGWPPQGSQEGRCQRKEMGKEPRSSRCQLCCTPLSSSVWE